MRLTIFLLVLVLGCCEKRQERDDDKLPYGCYRGWNTLVSNGVAVDVFHKINRYYETGTELEIEIALPRKVDRVEAVTKLTKLPYRINGRPAWRVHFNDRGAFGTVTIEMAATMWTPLLEDNILDVFTAPE